MQKAWNSWGSTPKWWGKGEHKVSAPWVPLAGQVQKTVPFWAIVSFRPPEIYGTSYVNVPFREVLWWKTLQQKMSESLAGDSQRYELYGPKAHELDTDKEMCLLPSSGQLRTSGMKSRSQMSIQFWHKGIRSFEASTDRKLPGSRLRAQCSSLHTRCLPAPKCVTPSSLSSPNTVAQHLWRCFALICKGEPLALKR